MKISTKGRYGLKAVIILAQNNKEVVPLTTLSREIGVGGAYIEQLMRLLKAEEIVQSHRGATGGYTLTKEANKTTVGEVLRALEDNLELVECLKTGACDCDCKVFPVWETIRDAINGALDNITIQSLLDK